MCWDVCGYVASGLVLAAFYMKDMVPLRTVALASNLAFIAYGLVPLNGWRLVEAARLRPKSRGRDKGVWFRSRRTEAGRENRPHMAIAL